ncbi:hypothetical protein ADK67_06990 [Saccharothrix sp. NRRL B-16348]|uniref:hypothetical protein n=1 Tax=Saccharothrix sp. NRRL B-16348 TaxID=1415542 RepID=UPI0006B05EE8|nr:hypothetical protein [Saccharothrix sp. NRRL B-16348]KOX33272.1 hypothetical protein ADK67_06990 [Saccharothrix sp. NRRL B-16348]
MISDALARAFHLLDQDMLGYLDTVERLTDERESDDETVRAVARTEVPRLIAALRGTLTNHQADAFGLCLGCAPTWLDGRFTRTPWPCPVVDAAHAFLKDPDSIYPR